MKVFRTNKVQPLGIQTLESENIEDVSIFNKIWNGIFASNNKTLEEEEEHHLYLVARRKQEMESNYFPSTVFSFLVEFIVGPIWCCLEHGCCLSGLCFLAN